MTNKLTVPVSYRGQCSRETRHGRTHRGQTVAASWAHWRHEERCVLPERVWRLLTGQTTLLVSLRSRKWCERGGTASCCWSRRAFANHDSDAPPSRKPLTTRSWTGARSPVPRRHMIVKKAWGFDRTSALLPSAAPVLCHGATVVQAKLLPDMSERLRIGEPTVGHHHPQRVESLLGEEEPWEAGAGVEPDRVPGRGVGRCS